MAKRIAAGCGFGLGFAILGALLGAQTLSLLAYLYISLTDLMAVRPGQALALHLIAPFFGSGLGAFVGFLVGAFYRYDRADEVLDTQEYPPPVPTPAVPASSHSTFTAPYRCGSEPEGQCGGQVTGKLWNCATWGLLTLLGLVAVQIGLGKLYAPEQSEVPPPPGVDLRHEAPVHAQLSGLDLKGANGRGAKLWSANLSQSNLRGADLRGADLRHANLSRLTERHIGGGMYELRMGFNFADGADLEGANLQRARLRHAKLSGASLRGADLRHADLRNTSLTDVDLDGADLRFANLTDASLTGRDLRNTKLQNADLQGAYLYDADLRGADLSGADLRAASFTPPWESPTPADAKLSNVKLSGARYDRHTRWPSGFDPVKAGAVRVE
jgi:uncharacterized protein YjbI with pentapeptide repeats